MRIIFASSEVFPFSKTGGLADVAGALPAALADLGHDVLVVSPWYAGLRGAPYWIGDVAVPFAGRFEPVGVGTLERDGVRYAFVGNPVFSRDQPYGHADDTRRFALFSRAVPQVAERVGFRPDVLHANDWHTGYLPLVLERGWHLPPGFEHVPSVFTVHNVQYQGESGLEEAAWWLRLPPEIAGSWLNHFGRANAMQAGMGSSRHVTTVSPTYAREIQEPEYGYGLDGSFRTLAQQRRLTGILNGIDTRVWNPAADELLPLPYDTANAAAGKAAAKERFCREYGLDMGRPLLAVVSRLAEQKGIDLLLEAAPGLLEQGFSLFVLGSGDGQLENGVAALAAGHPHAAAFIGYDEDLAHVTYAAADAVCVPSRFEPCGLVQLIGMRYGALPLVRHTGGLADTVSHLHTGFSFEHSSAWSLLGAAQVARDAYGTPVWDDLRRNAMNEDFSWNRSAQRFSGLYSGMVSG